MKVIAWCVGLSAVVLLFTIDCVRELIAHMACATTWYWPGGRPRCSHQIEYTPPDWVWWLVDHPSVFVLILIWTYGILHLLSKNWRRT